MALFSTKLRKASYDGVSFEVSSSDVNFGRRTVTHEYPQRDTPYTEDLGRLKRTFTITGFILGDDYISRTKRLIEKLETNGGTAKKLIHPWLGSLQVYSIDTPKVSWNAEKRISTFSIAFVEAGSLDNPTSSKSWGALIRAQADAWADALAGSLGLTWDQIDNFNEIVQEIATGQFQDILGAFSDCKFTKLFELKDNISELATTVASAMSKGADEFTSALFNAMGVGGYTASSINWGKATDAIKSVCNDKKVAASDNSLTVWNTRNKDLNTQKEQLTTSVKDQVRQVMLVQMIGAASMIGTALDEGASSRSDDEVLELRNNILETLENEMIYLGKDLTYQYEYIENAYHYVYRYLTDVVIASSNSITVIPPEVEPAVVLAYDRTENADNVDELVRRNRIIHPLFLPMKSIRISV